MTNLNSVSPNTLADLLGTPDAPVLIDVSIDQDVAADPYVIPGARRWPHTDIASLASVLRGQVVLTICQKGLKLSQGAAAILRAHGVSARALDTGNVGWKKAGLPRIALTTLPPDIPASQWVSAERPDIATLACAWFVRRFIDPAATFLFVEATEVPSVSEKYGATSLHCVTLAQFTAQFEFQAEAMTQFVRIIGAVHQSCSVEVPEAQGLSAIIEGLSRRFQNDLELLEASLIFFDALYQWTRELNPHCQPRTEAAT